MAIIKHRIAFFIVIGLISLAALGSVLSFGVPIGIDFKGGALLSVSYTDTRPPLPQIESSIAVLSLGEVRVQPSGEKGLLVRTRSITNDEKNGLEAGLSLFGNAPLHEDSYTEIGPSIGKELANKALVAIVTIVVLLLAFITFAFRKVSEPVASWKYAVIAIFTLIHDVLIPTGVFAYLGHVAGAEADSLFVVALLTILGISINDTIVVFDRIRENLRVNQETGAREAFEDTVGKSLNQTIVRSINTSLTVIAVLVALFIWGPETTKNFALMLTVGMVAGTYSSIFLASPLLVVWEKLSRKKA